MPVGRTDKGGGASKVNYPFKGGSKRIRLWEKREEPEPDRYYRRVMGFKTEQTERTPVGNIRLVRYDKEEAELLSAHETRDQLKELDQHGLTKKEFNRLLYGGDWVSEGEWVDASELPEKYKVGEWFSEYWE